MSVAFKPAELPQAASSGSSGRAAGIAARLRQNAKGMLTPTVIVGLVILGIFALLAVIGPYIASSNPSATTAAVLQAPSLHHLLGTTQTGQDVLSELLVGTRTSMVVAFTAGAFATLLAVLIGTASGLIGGLADELLSALTNVFLVIPALPLAIVLAGYMPNGGEIALVLVISLTGWSWSARVIRVQALSLRNRDYVLAARASGESTLHLVLVETVPDLLPVIAIQFLSLVLFAILTEAGLAFLGLGGTSGWSWGNMLYWATEDTAWSQGAWWWFLPPGLCIALVGTSLALINFGTDEVLNPRLRSARIARSQTKRAGTRRSVDGRSVDGRSVDGRSVDGRSVDRRSEGLRGAAGGSDQPGTLSAPDQSASDAKRDVLLEVRDLTVAYQTNDEPIRAVRNVSFELRRGEVLGIAGESGCGKSTLAYAICQVQRPPAVITGGSLRYRQTVGSPQVDLLALTAKERSSFRWQEMAVVFQSAMNSLNPVIDVQAQLTDSLASHRPSWTKAQRVARAAEVLTMVGISKNRLRSYPHELSGGMRQRVAIAMALVLEPKIVIMDEPTTALDVVVQREILEQFTDLRQVLDFSVIFITHDLSLLFEFADRIAVMYAGAIVEVGRSADLYQRPGHPYTHGLGSCFPNVTGPLKAVRGIPGSPPDLRNLPQGCAFEARCEYHLPACAMQRPVLVPGRPPLHEESLVACFLHDPRLNDSLPAALTLGHVSNV
jgi:peptide/nickel transport system permease protein